MFADEGLQWTIAIAVVFSIIHLLAVHLRRHLHARESVVNSMGGGMAAAYVFVLLLPELEGHHGGLGGWMHFIMLVSFTMTYGLDGWLQSRTERSRGKGGRTSRASSFHLHLSLAWIYSWLIVYAMPQRVEEGVFYAVVGAIAIGFHLLYKDYSLWKQHPEEFASWGGYTLALAPIAGGICNYFAEFASELASDITLAIVAGFILFNVFKEELPDPKAANFRWFAVGIAVCALLLLLAEGLRLEEI